MYNSQGDLCGAIENDAVTTDTLEIFMNIENNKKNIWMSNGDYSVKLVATGVGTMECLVREYSEGQKRRIIAFNSVPLSLDIICQENIVEQLDIPATEYALRSNAGESIYANEESYLYYIKFDPASGVMNLDDSVMVTGTGNKLVSLPTPPVTATPLTAGTRRQLTAKKLT